MPHRFHGVSLRAHLSEFSLKAGEHFSLVPAFLWPFVEAFGKRGAIELSKPLKFSFLHHAVLLALLRTLFTVSSLRCFPNITHLY